MPKVHVFERDKDIEFKCRAGSNLRKVLLEHKVQLYAGLHRFVNRRGMGLCGSCLVRVESNPAGLTDRTPTEESKLFGSNPHIRLACQAEVCGDIEISTGV